MKIGFSVESDENLPETAAVTLPVSDIPAAVRSLVQVRFEDDGRVLTYKCYDQVQDQSGQL